LVTRISDAWTQPMNEQCDRFVATSVANSDPLLCKCDARTALSVLLKPIVSQLFFHCSCFNVHRVVVRSQAVSLESWNGTTQLCKYQANRK